MTQTSARGSRFTVVPTLVFALALAGCVAAQPHRTPTDPGIPEARAVAAAQLAQMRTRLVLSDRVIVLGDVHQDSCGTAENWWFDDTKDLGYRCESAWTTIAVIPDARTPKETAAAVDAEMAELDLPYQAGGMVRDWMLVYPPVRQDAEIAALSAGGHEGAVRFDVYTSAFSPDEWSAPWKGNVDVEPPADTAVAEITAAEVAATGANQVIRFTASVEYWNTRGIPNLDDAEPPQTVDTQMWRYGDDFAVELADWAPAEAPVPCIADPAVDQTSMLSVDEPFPYRRFAFVPAASYADQQRVRDCVLSALESGTVVVLSPAE